MARDFTWLSSKNLPIAGISTPWETIGMARKGGTEGKKALDDLAVLYRDGVRLAIGGMVQESARANELAQGFMVIFLEGTLVAQADRERGSFGSWVITWVRNYVRTELDKEAIRTGVALDPAELQAREAAVEEVFHRQIVIARMEEARRRLAKRIEPTSEAGRVFEAVHIAGGPSRSQRVVAEEMGIPLRRFEEGLRLARHAFRNELLLVMRNEVSTPEQLEEEVDRMIKVLSGPGAPRWGARRAR